MLQCRAALFSRSTDPSAVKSAVLALTLAAPYEIQHGAAVTLGNADTYIIRRDVKHVTGFLRVSG